MICLIDGTSESTKKSLLEEFLKYFNKIELSVLDLSVNSDKLVDGIDVFNLLDSINKTVVQYDLVVVKGNGLLRFSQLTNLDDCHQLFLESSFIEYLVSKILNKPKNIGWITYYKSQLKEDITSFFKLNSSISKNNVRVLSKDSFFRLVVIGFSCDALTNKYKVG